MIPNEFHALTVIGPGAWGTALGSVVASKAVTVDTLGLESHESDWARSLPPGRLVLIATPFSAIHGILPRLKRFKISGVINASKGIDRDSLLTFTQLARKSLKCPVATLSGPTFALEVQQQKPTACVIASKDTAFLSRVSKLFTTPFFRVYKNSDPVGVEISGALKNVLAIACGISDGLGLGLNARAALLTRGLVEMEALVRLFHGKASTVYGLAGVGDLWLTATGDLSRNRRFGLALARGLNVQQALAEINGPAEGYYTVDQVFKLSQRKKIDLPISEQVYNICHSGGSPRDALQRLMTRDPKAEATKTRQRPRKSLSKR